MRNAHEVRVAKGYDQRALAARLAVSRTTLSRFESGECIPSIFRVAEISGALGISLDALLRESVLLEDPFIRSLVLILRGAQPAARAAIVQRLMILAGLTGKMPPPEFSFIPPLTRVREKV
jgi:transcriptional regulator with XRE-family HTH domain